MDERLALSASSSAGLLSAGGASLSSVLLFFSASGPRTIKMVSIQICGRLILARIVLTLTDLEDLLSWHSNLCFPLNVGVLVVVTFWTGCCLLALQVAMPMVEFPGVSCVSSSSSVPRMKKMTSMGWQCSICRIIGLHRGA